MNRKNQYPTSIPILLLSILFILTNKVQAQNQLEIRTGNYQIEQNKYTQQSISATTGQDTASLNLEGKERSTSFSIGLVYTYTPKTDNPGKAGTPYRRIILQANPTILKTELTTATQGGITNNSILEGTGISITAAWGMGREYALQNFRIRLGIETGLTYTPKVKQTTQAETTSINFPDTRNITSTLTSPGNMTAYLRLHGGIRYAIKDRFQIGLELQYGPEINLTYGNQRYEAETRTTQSNTTINTEETENLTEYQIQLPNQIPTPFLTFGIQL